MQYREIQPGAAVRGIVEHFWILECGRSQAGEIQRVVPDGRPELILNFGEPFESLQAGQWRRQPRCFLAGQITGPLFLRPSGPARILGIRFHPHGAGQVFRLPMQEVRDLAVPVADLSPALAGALDVPDSLDIAAVEAALIRHAGGEDQLVAAAVGQILRQNGMLDLGRLAARLGIGTRQLERRFERRVGLPPKRFARMQRFQRVFQEIGEGGGNWVDAAIACGYYDQAHLIRDFKDFSGQPPQVLLDSADLARHFIAHRQMSDLSKTATGRAR